MTSNDDTERLRALVARSCQILGRLNLTHEPQGHVSTRIPGTEHLLIKARGPGEAPLSYVGPDGIIRIDLSGREVEGGAGLSVPSEVFIHTWIYRMRPEVNAVVHVHPPTVVAFTICNRPLLPVVGAFNPATVRLYEDGLPVYPHSFLINNDDRGRALAQALGRSRVCLLRGHGIAAVGRSVEEATLTAITLNDLAEMNWKAAMLGTSEPVPAEELADLRPAGLSFSEPGEQFTASEWQYYDRLVGP